MDADINDIWDLPLENPVNNPSGERPTSSSRASSQPLFLPSDDDEDNAVPNNATTRNDANNPNPSDIDALFEGIDDIDDSFQELAPGLDLDALRREADARNARAVRAELGVNIPATGLSTTSGAAVAKTKRDGGGVLDGLDDGDGEDDGKKKRKPLPKLDETRLLGKDGFPQLLKDTKDFKPKGKGHEGMDLDRVLQIYQFWSHKLYPKTRFKETVDRVEKLCHSRRMEVALSVWHDEAKGLVNGVRLPTAADDDNDSDEDPESDSALHDNETARAAASAATTTRTADKGATISSTSAPSSPAQSRLRHSGEGSGGDVSTMSDSDRDSNTPHLSSDASRPPSSSPTSPDGDRDRDAAAIELDALLEAKAEAASSHAPTNHAWKGTSNGNADAIAMDEDEDLWDTLDAVTSVETTVTTPAPAPAPLAMPMDDDQEMWDIMHELEQEKAKETVHRPDLPVQVPPPPASDTQPETDDLDDLYL